MTKININININKCNGCWLFLFFFHFFLAAPLIFFFILSSLSLHHFCSLRSSYNDWIYIYRKSATTLWPFLWIIGCNIVFFCAMCFHIKGQFHIHVNLYNILYNVLYFCYVTCFFFSFVSTLSSVSMVKSHCTQHMDLSSAYDGSWMNKMKTDYYFICGWNIDLIGLSI